MPEHPDFDLFVVDSDAATRSRLEKLCRKQGYEVRGFSHGLAVVHAFEQKMIPRLIVVELLLPGMDGFELCGKLRSELAGPELEILCTSSLSWGAADLPGLLASKFRAGFLAKPFSVEDITDALEAFLGAPEAPVHEVTDADIEEPEPIGSAESERLAELTEAYSATNEEPEVSPDRKHVRVDHEFAVKLDVAGALVRETTQNISTGGLFIRTDLLPELGDIVQVQLELPERTVETRAKVVRQVSEDEARAIGSHPGVGVAFIGMAPEDLALLESMVESLHDRVRAQDKGKETRAVVAIGEALRPTLDAPSFLHRRDTMAMVFDTLENAEDFLLTQPTVACVVDEEAVQGGLHEYFLRLSDRVGPTTVRLLVSNRKDVAGLVAEGLCENVVSDGKMLLSVLERHLRLEARRAPRVAHRVPVAWEGIGAQAATMLNLSAQGALLRSRQEADIGEEFRLEFAVSEHAMVAVRARVVRFNKHEHAREGTIGVQFVSYEGESESLIKRLVQSRVQFGEYFQWMKQAVFPEEAKEDKAPEEEAQSKDKWRDIFGLE